MNTTELETTVAGPIQHLGMSFYFDPATGEAAKEHDLNVFEFYGLGRGGVLGDVDVNDVTRAFWFFHERAVKGLWSPARAKVAPDVAARAHLDAAYAYAERTFSSVPEMTLRTYADAARKVIDAVPAGRYELFDGYRNFPVPAEAVRAAYLATVVLRELRGGVHIFTTQEFGIAANEACFMTNEGIFKMHGYRDEDAPERSEDLERRMQQAEELTTATMAGFLDVLSDAERQALADGVLAMQSAFDAAAGGS